MNLYATTTDTAARPGAHTSAADSLMLELLEIASRQIDEFCHRVFYTEQATKYFSVVDADWVFIDDLISIDSLTTDSELDGTYDGETWVEDTDFRLWPRNSFPKMRIERTAWGNYSFAEQEDYLKIVGTWGYGNGTSDPWNPTAITATVADASSATLTLSAEGTLVAGQTIKVGSEQMYISAVTGDGSDTATVERGVNGTTAAAHTAETASVALYPLSVKRGAIQLAIELYAEAGRDGSLQNERIGDYSYQRWENNQVYKRMAQMLGAYRR